MTKKILFLLIALIVGFILFKIMAMMFYFAFKVVTTLFTLIIVLLFAVPIYLLLNKKY